MRLANYRAFSQYSTSCTKLKIPKFAPDHSLRTMGLDLNIGLFVREFTLSSINKSIEIVVGMNPKHIMLSGFTVYVMLDLWINQYSGRIVII